MSDFFNQNPYNPFLLPGDFTSGGTEQYPDIATRNRQMTFLEDLMRLYSSPMFNLYTAAETGAPTIDWAALAGVNAFGGGGAGGGGGAATGGTGAVGTVPTPWLSGNYEEGSIDAMIRDNVLIGKNPEQIVNEIREDTNETNPDVLAGIRNTANQMFDEFNASQNAVPGQTQLQQIFAKTGIPNPLENPVYTGENLPQGFGVPEAQTITGENIDRYQQQLDEANRFLQTGPIANAARPLNLGENLTQGLANIDIGDVSYIPGVGGLGTAAKGMGLDRLLGGVVKGQPSGVTIGEVRPLAPGARRGVGQPQPIRRAPKADDIVYGGAGATINFDRNRGALVRQQGLRNMIAREQNREQDYRNFIARGLQQAGRTPLQDAFRAREAMVRQMMGMF